MFRVIILQSKTGGTLCLKPTKLQRARIKEKHKVKLETKAV